MGGFDKYRRRADLLAGQRFHSRSVLGERCSRPDGFLHGRTADRGGERLGEADEVHGMFLRAPWWLPPMVSAVLGVFFLRSRGGTMHRRREGEGFGECARSNMEAGVHRKDLGSLANRQECVRRSTTAETKPRLTTPKREIHSDAACQGEKRKTRYATARIFSLPLDRKINAALSPVPNEVAALPRRPFSPGSSPLSLPLSPAFVFHCVCAWSCVLRRFVQIACSPAAHARPTLPCATKSRGRRRGMGRQDTR